MKVDKRVRVTPEKLKRMQELRSQGMTYQRIATTVHLSYLTVYKYLNHQKELINSVEEKPEENVLTVKVGFLDKLKVKLGM